MQKDFHFYLIYSLLLDCGSKKEEAEIVAFASQYVDDNNEHQVVKAKTASKEVHFNNEIHVGDQVYRGIITQTFSLKSFTDEIQYYVLIPFHFLPGNSQEIMFKKRANRYSTIPANNSPFAEELFGEVLKSGNNYRLGALLHTLVDTYSHQNFSGIEDGWNSVYPWYSPYSIAPNIGHAEVGQQPDTISDCWYDKRFSRQQQRIENKERAMSCVEYIFRKLYAHKHPEDDIDKVWASKEKTYQSIIYGPDKKRDTYDYDERIESIKKYVKRPDLKYDRKKWIESAIKFNDKKGHFEAVSPQNFTKSHYWKLLLRCKFLLLGI